MTVHAAAGDGDDTTDPRRRERRQHVQGSGDVDVGGLDEPRALHLGLDRGDRGAVNGPDGPDVLDQAGDRGAIGHVDLPKAHAAWQALEKSAQGRIRWLEVDADDVVAALGQVTDQVRHDEPGRARDQDGVAHQPLTEPAVRPCTICFWKTSTSRTAGSAPRKPEAAMTE
jgi:hypothetical protein